MLLTYLSSLFLSLTVMTDKLMMGDFYQKDPKVAWVVSSVAGSIFGLTATIILWLLLPIPTITSLFTDLIANNLFLVFLLVIAGVLSTLSLRCYFQLMSRDIISTSISIAIATTPIFVFVTQSFITEGVFSLNNLISFLITIIGLIGYELISSDYNNNAKTKNLYSYVFGVIAFGTLYVLIIDEIYILASSALNTNNTMELAAALLPFYWIGFGIGFINLTDSKITLTLKSILKRKQFLYIILFLEVIGSLFFFFEFLGLSEISATLVALIVGAHVIFVWLFDLYLRYKYIYCSKNNYPTVKIMLFCLPTEQLSYYATPTRTVILQLLLILMVLFGLSIWN